MGGFIFPAVFKGKNEREREEGKTQPVLKNGRREGQGQQIRPVCSATA